MTSDISKIFGLYPFAGSYRLNHSAGGDAVWLQNIIYSLYFHQTNAKTLSIGKLLLIFHLNRFENFPSTNRKPRHADTKTCVFEVENIALP